MLAFVLCLLAAPSEPVVVSIDQLAVGRKDGDAWVAVEKGFVNPRPTLVFTKASSTGLGDKLTVRMWVGRGKEGVRVGEGPLPDQPELLVSGGRAKMHPSSSLPLDDANTLAWVKRHLGDASGATLEQVVQIDLEGDGQPEVFAAATSGETSVALLLRDGEVIQLAKETSGEQRGPFTIRLVAPVDADGDGTAELPISIREPWSVTGVLYAVRNGKIVLVGRQTMGE